MAEPAAKRGPVGVGDHGHRHGFIEHDDPCWSCPCPNIIEVASQSFDRDALGIGTSPYLGDVGYLGVRVPQIPTPDQTHRFLMRLAAVPVANNRVLLLRGIRQLVTIGAFGTAGDEPAGCTSVLVEKTVENPWWRFADGNVSWHVRWESTFGSRLYVVDPAQQPGTSTTLWGTDTALLYSPPFPPYTPPGAGLPPGTGVGAFGTFHDIRFPWDHSHWEMSERLEGPGTLVLYASVHQTDPETRCPIFVPTAGIDVLSEEDQFVAAFEDDDIDVMYQRVAGALIVEIFPCCK